MGTQICCENHENTQVQKYESNISSAVCGGRVFVQFGNVFNAQVPIENHDVGHFAVGHFSARVPTYMRVPIPKRKARNTT